MFYRLIALAICVVAGFMLEDRPSIFARALTLAILAFVALAAWRSPAVIELEKIRALQIAQLRHVSTCPLCGMIADDPNAETKCSGVAHFNAVNRRKLQRA